MNNPHSDLLESARSIVIGLVLVMSFTIHSPCFGAKVGLARPGDGYPGRIEPYLASAELKAQMSRFGMTAGWFRRDELPEAKNDGCKSGPTDEMPYLLYSPRRGNKPVPMVVYFGGTGEQGTNLVSLFRQTTVFSHLTAPDFQKGHPCYIFAPMMPKGAVIRAALPGESSRLAALTCDAMYAVIKTLKHPPVDANRLYVTGLSWGGVATFELACSFPGRFAACVPTACIQSPLRIPRKSPGNYWMLYNENEYASGWSQKAIREIEEIVRAGGGDFRRSTFPDRGHDAWSKAWRENAVWEWVFSKGAIGGKSTRGVSGRVRQSPAFRAIAEASCSSSVPGKDDGCGPERMLDGLDATAYVSAHDVGNGDWVEIVCKESVSGRIEFVSGFRDGSCKLVNAIVEASEGDGRVWNRVGMFSGKSGVARVELRSPVTKFRVTYVGRKPVKMVLRKVVPKER